MTDLSTSYLGLKLRNPLVCSSSPLCEDLDSLARMEEAGAAAVVLHSLFEEQLTVESLDLHRNLEGPAESYAEATSYFPDMLGYNRGPERYLEHLARAKARLQIPVIASLNGATPGGWVWFARRTAEAGADALELNLYDIPTSTALPGAEVERRHAGLVAEVCAHVRVPVAVKLGMQLTAPAAFARQLDAAGARGLVLFNRFYQPDFDLENLEVVPSLQLSTPAELLLRLHWVAILFGQVKADLAVTGGVHGPRDVLKVMMAGGRVAMMTSALLKHGIDHLRRVLDGVGAWMAEHDYQSVRQMQGSMSLRRVADPGAFLRGNYMKVLRSYALKETPAP
jgi:dihydroorotate dehydrogenase (fumarate)